MAETANAPQTPGGLPKLPPRHVLPFEQHLSALELQIIELDAVQASKGIDYSAEIHQFRTNYTALLRKTYEGLTAWQTVQVARHPQRPLFQRLCRVDLPRIP